MSNIIKIVAVMVFFIGCITIAPEAQARRAKPMVDPPTVSLNCELSKKQINQGISAAMTELGWTGDFSEKDVKGHINVRGKHTLRVSVANSGDSFNVNYHSSENLKYVVKKGQPRIHPNASSWMSNLSNAISNQLKLMCT